MMYTALYLGASLLVVWAAIQGSKHDGSSPEEKHKRALRTTNEHYDGEQHH